jgi:hypothetical protein
VLAVFAPAFGGGAELRLEATVDFGAEDDWRGSVPAGTLAVVLFDIAATPEAENQGRFVQQLAAAAGAPLPMLVDEAGFKRRFDAQRLHARRASWSAFGEPLGVQPVFVDLQAPDLPAAAAALHARQAEGAAALQRA